MIKNIVFDISNVLAPFRYKEFLAEKGFDAAMIKRIIKASAMIVSTFLDWYILVTEKCKSRRNEEKTNRN